MTEQLTEIQQTMLDSMQDGLHFIPGHMRESVINYVVHRIPPGDFLRAVLINDFCDAAARADEINGRCFRGWGAFMYWHVPMAARGSASRVRAWLKADPRGEDDAAAYQGGDEPR